MTDENIRHNINIELDRAEQAFRAAQVLHDNELLSDSVSRLYYCALYTVRALLLSKGIEARSHEGALRLLGLHFIRAGVFPPAFSHILSVLMKHRQEADYNPAYMFTPEDFQEFRARTLDLREKVKEYVGKKGFIE